MGTRAIEGLEHIQADMFFLGVTGVHEEQGLTTGDCEEAFMKRALSKHAAETIVMASDEKIGVVSPYLVLPILQSNAIIVDKHLPKEKLNMIANLGVKIIHSN